MVGGLLVALAALGAFAVSASGASDGRGSVVVAADDLHPGEVVTADDVELARASLPSSAHGFAMVEDVLGRVALGPVGRGEVLQASSLTDDTVAAGSRREVALTLPPEQVAVGRLRVGERVDVFVTYDEQTSSIVEGAEVVQLTLGDDSSLTRQGDISLVVSVESKELVAALVHALRTGAVTVVRSTLAEEADDEPTAFAPQAPTTTTPDDR